MKILAINKQRETTKIFYEWEGIKDITISNDLYDIDALLDSDLDQEINLNKFKLFHDLPWMSKYNNPGEFEFASKYDQYIPMISKYIKHSKMGNNIALNICIFLNKLIENKLCEDQKMMLVKFISNNNLPILPNGNFMAYKYLLKGDGYLIDNHSRSIKQNVGDLITMNINRIDKDPNNHCSTGLHVGNNLYMKEINDNFIICLVEVDPNDVVVVPIEDPNKIRVQKYGIIHELSLASSNLIMEGDYHSIDKKDLEFLINIQEYNSKPFVEEEVKKYSIEDTVKQLYRKGMSLNKIHKSTGISMRKVYKILGKKY